MIVFSVAVLSFPVMSRPFFKHLSTVDILTLCLVSRKEAGLRIPVLTVYHSEKKCKTLGWTSFFELLLMQIMAKLTGICSDFRVKVVKPKKVKSLSKTERHIWG